MIQHNTTVAPQRKVSRIARIKDRFIDMGTANKSFLQVAADLKTVGIKNWYFMLEIYDYTLVNVDPYACDKDGHTTLSKDQIARIMTECTKNPWYYLREIARIPDPGGSAVSYIANRGNIAQAWCIWKGLDSWLCLPRQQGKTQSALAFQAWMYNFGTTNSSFIFVNKDGDQCKQNLKRLRDQLELLPEYLQFDSYVDADGKRVRSQKNATTLKNPINGNNIIVKAKATSYDSALSLARGLTAPVLYFDEPEFTNQIKVIVENSVSTYDTAARRARENGAMYGRIFTCTPGDLSTSMGMQSQELLNNCAHWTETLYDKTEEEIQEYFKCQGKDCNRILYIEYQYYQIGKDKEWLEELSAKIGNPLTVRREILLQRLHGSSASPYAQEDIEYIVETQQKPIKELWIMSYFKFDVYETLDRSIPYIVGIDCSTGTTKDNNAITVINPYTARPVAEFECSYIGETKYEELIKELVMDYIPRAIVCIERNSVGDGIIDHLLVSPIASRLYYDKSKDLVEDNMNQHESVESMLKKRAQQKSYYGVYTNASSRDDMFAILSRRVMEYKEDFVTNNVIRDLSRLVVTGSGKIEAGQGEGFHDDSIMSYLIGMYVFYHGNNLPAFGFIRGESLDKPKNAGMKRPEEINPALVNPELIEFAKKQEAINQQADWEDLMRATLKRSQAETMQLHKRNMVQNDIFANSVDASADTFEESGSIDLSFFNELNGF